MDDVKEAVKQNQEAHVRLVQRNIPEQVKDRRKRKYIYYVLSRTGRVE